MSLLWRDCPAVRGCRHVRNRVTPTCRPGRLPRTTRPRGADHEGCFQAEEAREEAGAEEPQGEAGREEGCVLQEVRRL